MIYGISKNGSLAAKDNNKTSWDYEETKGDIYNAINYETLLSLDTTYFARIENMLRILLAAP